VGGGKQTGKKLAPGSPPTHGVAKDGGDNQTVSARNKKRGQKRPTRGEKKRRHVMGPRAGKKEGRGNKNGKGGGGGRRNGTKGLKSVKASTRFLQVPGRTGGHTYEKRFSKDRERGKGGDERGRKGN